MSKRPRHPDQAAIDMATVGAFLTATALAYKVATLVETAVENTADTSTQERVKEGADVLLWQIALGPIGGIIGSTKLLKKKLGGS